MFATRRSFDGGGVQRFAIGVDFFEGARDVVDVGSAAEKNTLFEPNALFAAEEIAVGDLGFGEI
jgi:hypothetical protein